MRSRRTSRRRRNDEATESEIEKTRVFQRGETRPKRSWLRVAGLVAGAVLLFLAGAAFGLYRFTSQLSPGLVPDEYKPTYEGRINILVLGIDTGVNGTLKNPQADITGTRSDVVMLVSFDPVTKEVGILSIPRDTRVYIPEVVFDYEKVAHAHAYGGPELSVKTVAGFLGVDIHHYVRFDFEAFKKAIDLLGGVDVDVPQDMNYDDPYQNLHIHLKKGMQHLNGEQALGLVRYRYGYEDGDIGRIETQEIFLKALIKKAASLSGAMKIPELIKTMSPYVKTDLSTQDILNLANMAIGVKPEDVRMGIVPGVPQNISDGREELSYWVADRTATDELVDDLIRGISKEKNALIKVAVQNGNGVAGAADALAAKLRADGFDVVSVGNASKQDYAETRVVASGNSAAMWAVLRCLKDVCSQAKTYEGKVPSGAQVLVIVGKDYKIPTSS